MARPGGLNVDRPILCLPPATGQLPEHGGVVVRSAAPPFRKHIEHAGHGYQQKLVETYALHKPDKHVEQQELQKDKEKQQNGTAEKRPDSETAAKSLASKMAVGSDDLYELLELGEKRWHATADDIKKSFRRISLIYHPDKISHQGEQARENSETHFKAVKKAYDILSDKKKRAAYDSIDDVDDSIPSEKDATSSPERFYDKFGHCFAMNARWSISNRVPVLGNDDTDINAVNKFYDFWYSFKSWRDFSFDLEYDTDQAECREEKRWMERQNSKHVKSRKLEENARIRRLVDLAYKHDPRIRRVRDEAKAKKDAAKIEKKRKAEEASRLAKEKEEQDRIEADKKAADEKIRRAEAKKQKDAARQVMRKARQKLRAVGRELHITDSEQGLVLVEKMCAEGSVESIHSLRGTLASLAVEENQSIISQAMKILELASQRPRKPITAEEVADINSSEKCEETNKECEEQSTAAANDTTASSAEQQQRKANGLHQEEKVQETVWTAEELSLLSKGVTKFPGGTRDRWNRLAEYLGTKTADEVLRKVNESRPSKIKSGGAAQAGRTGPAPDAFARFQEKKKGKPVAPQAAKDSSPTGTVASAASAAAPAPVPNQPPNTLGFTPKQQRNLETALKKFATYQGDEKWKRVAKVTERGADECKERYAELIAYYQAKKRAAAAKE